MSAPETLRDDLMDTINGMGCLDGPPQAELRARFDAIIAAARAESDALRAALENACPIDHRRVPPSRCQVIYLGEPDGATCLDRQARAAEPSSRFTPEFRARLVAGEHLCKGCRAMLALGERAALAPSPAEPAAPERCLVCDHVVHPSTEECDCRCVAAPEREP